MSRAELLRCEEQPHRTKALDRLGQREMEKEKTGSLRAFAGCNAALQLINC
jgi:hypothetical protein